MFFSNFTNIEIIRLKSPINEYVFRKKRQQKGSLLNVKYLKINKTYIVNNKIKIVPLKNVITVFFCNQPNYSIFIQLHMEKTLVILKPSAVQRNLIGEITTRFERKGLRLAAIKMMQLDEKILNEHYAHLKDKPFFQKVKDSMKSSPVIVQCWEGVDAAKVVRNIIGKTNGREASAGTIRGDFSVSSQENVVHASDSPESAAVELKRFFSDNEIFEYNPLTISRLYAQDEI